MDASTNYTSPAAKAFQPAAADQFTHANSKPDQEHAAQLPAPRTVGGITFTPNDPGGLVFPSSPDAQGMRDLIELHAADVAALRDYLCHEHTDAPEVDAQRVQLREAQRILAAMTAHEEDGTPIDPADEHRFFDEVLPLAAGLVKGRTAQAPTSAPLPDAERTTLEASHRDELATQAAGLD